MAAQNQSTPTSTYMIMIKYSPLLEQLRTTQKKGERNSSLMQRILTEEKAMMSQIDIHLRNLGYNEGTDYSLLFKIHTAIAKLTLEEVEKLRKEPYVKGIVEDSDIELVE
jgi:hypothetical protein